LTAEKLEDRLNAAVVLVEMYRTIPRNTTDGSKETPLDGDLRQLLLKTILESDFDKYDNTPIGQMPRGYHEHNPVNLLGTLGISTHSPGFDEATAAIQAVHSPSGQPLQVYAITRLQFQVYIDSEACKQQVIKVNKSRLNLRVPEDAR
jgi:hypothetical protein